MGDGIVVQIESDGALGSHADQGVVRARAVVVPAVNGDCHRMRQLDALQLQIVRNQAGREGGKRMEPRLNDHRVKGVF